jgi:dihydrofolate reductase
MGRKTLELIGRPLPGRENIVLTRNSSYRERGFHIAHDIPAAITVARWLLDQATGIGSSTGDESEVMVIGGGEVYRQFLPLADRVYLTIVEGEFAGTATFPFEELAKAVWELREREDWPADTDNPFAHRFFVLDRARSAITSPVSVVEPARLIAG